MAEKVGYKTSFLKSLCIHALILAGFAVALQAPDTVTHFAGTEAKVVKATMISPQAVDQAITAMNQAHNQQVAKAVAQKKQVDQQLLQAKQEREKTQKMLEQLKKQNALAVEKREQMLKDIAKAKEQQQQAREKLAAAEAAQKKAAIQAAKNKAILKQQINSLKREKIKVEKALAEKKKRELEKKRRIEKQRQRAEQKRQQQAALEKKKQEAAVEAKRQAKIAAEKKRQVVLAQLKANAQSNIARQLEANAKAAAARSARQKYVQSEIDKYSGLIRATIQSHWNQANIDPNLNALIQVHVNLSGDILSVKVIKSSGNTIFDRQARLAVLSAGRLPMPTDKDVAKQFLSFNFHFTPQGVS